MTKREVGRQSNGDVNFAVAEATPLVMPCTGLMEKSCGRQQISAENPGRQYIEGRTLVGARWLTLTDDVSGVSGEAISLGTAGIR